MTGEQAGQGADYRPYVVCYDPTERTATIHVATCAHCDANTPPDADSPVRWRSDICVGIRRAEAESRRVSRRNVLYCKDCLGADDTSLIDIPPA